jgi:hypothetical protein
LKGAQPRCAGGTRRSILACGQPPRRGEIPLLTTDPDLDTAGLLDLLEHADRETRKLTGLDAWTERRVSLVVLRDAAELTRALRLVGERYGVTASAEPRESWFFEQIAFSTATTERTRIGIGAFAGRVALESVLGITGQDGWLSRGLPYVALARRSREDERATATWVRGEAVQTEILSLPDLCRGARLPRLRGWQAFTVVEVLLENERLKPNWIPLLEALRAAGSTNLEPHLRPVPGIDWDILEGLWRAHCRHAMGSSRATERT